MKLAIMSDSHDNWEKLEEAVDIANNEKCEILLHAGDLISPPGIKILEKFNGEVKFVWGNNEGERMGMTRKFDESEKLFLSGDIYEGEFDGIRIFMNHYPQIVENAAQTANYDLCIYGHTHEYDERKVGETIVLNPGEIQGYRSGESSFVIFDSNDRSVRKVVA